MCGWRSCFWMECLGEVSQRTLNYARGERTRPTWHLCEMCMICLVSVLDESTVTRKCVLMRRMDDNGVARWWHGRVVNVVNGRSGNAEMWTERDEASENVYRCDLNAMFAPGDICLLESFEFIDSLFWRYLFLFSADSKFGYKQGTQAPNPRWGTVEGSPMRYWLHCVPRCQTEHSFCKELCIAKLLQPY